MSDYDFMSEYEFFSLAVILAASLLQSQCLYPKPLFADSTASMHRFHCHADAFIGSYSCWNMCGNVDRILHREQIRWVTKWKIEKQCQMKNCLSKGWNSFRWILLDNGSILTYNEAWDLRLYSIRSSLLSKDIANLAIYPFQEGHSSGICLCDSSMNLLKGMNS